MLLEAVHHAIVFQHSFKQFVKLILTKIHEYQPTLNGVQNSHAFAISGSVLERSQYLPLITENLLPEVIFLKSGNTLDSEGFPCGNRDYASDLEFFGAE